MLLQESIKCYQGDVLARGSSFLYIPPHRLLQPYISNYTISFPTPQSMPDGYTVLPTASSTLVISVSTDNIISVLRGVNIKACNVGAHANKMKLLLLVEFHPGGLYPFFRMDQWEVADSSFTLDGLDKALAQTLEDVLMASGHVKVLVNALDRIFIARLPERNQRDTGVSFPGILCDIIHRHGNINARELSSEFCYSEKHVRRLFLRYVGASPKTFSRIVRVNYALRLLQLPPQRVIADVAAEAGFFDQPHLIHDFKSICGLTPQAYIQNMSVFYNDWFKM